VGLKQDIAEAARWLREAADQGKARPQTNLAWLYAYGEGVPKDCVLAYMWLDLAAARDAQAEREWDNLAKEMTSGEIAEAAEERSSRGVGVRTA